MSNMVYPSQQRSAGRRLLWLIPLAVLAFMFLLCGACALVARTVLFTRTAAPVSNASSDQITQHYIALAQQDAQEVGISPGFFVRQISVESGFDPQSRSPAGAEGIAQLMPATAASLGVDPWNPDAALKAAAHLMARYDSLYGGDYAKALAAYNAGTGAVHSAIHECGNAHWMNCLPGETQRYIQMIMS